MEETKHGRASYATSQLCTKNVSSKFVQKLYFDHMYASCFIFNVLSLKKRECELIAKNENKIEINWVKQILF